MPSCKYCGQHGLRWVYTRQQGWRLYPNDGPVHTCSRGLQRAAERHTRELPQPAEERYPERFAALQQALAETRSVRGHGAQHPTPEPDTLGLPTRTMHGPEFEFDNLPSHGAEWPT